MIYAIDYGTSNSLLAVCDPSGTHDPLPIDPTSSDPTVLKSVLYSPHKGEWFFGSQAIREYTSHGAAGRLLRSIKKYLPDRDFDGTSIHGRRYNLPDLIAVFLKTMRERANQHTGRDVTAVLLGRPAAFSLDDRADQLAEDRLRLAAQAAGFKYVEFCPEPVAAAYEFRHSLTEPKTVLIADFGGGTSDFSVVKLGQQTFRKEDVLAIGGVAMAGDMFDSAIMKHLIAPHFGSEVVYRLPLGSNDLKLPRRLINKLCSPADISFLGRRDINSLLRDAQKWSLSEQDSQKMERLFLLVEEHLGYELFRQIEKIKIHLSQEGSTYFEFAYPGIDIREQVVSSDFKSASHPVVESIVKCLDQTIKAAQVQTGDIDIVCCTGGTAQIPALSWELGRRFGPEKLRQHRHFHSVISGLTERAKELL